MTEGVSPRLCNTMRIAKYGPPVQGSSTAATNIPSIIAPGIEAFLAYLFIVSIFAAGIVNDVSQSSHQSADG